MREVYLNPSSRRGHLGPERLRDLLKVTEQAKVELRWELAMWF